MVTTTVDNDDVCFFLWSIGCYNLTVTPNVERYQNPTRAMLVGVVHL